MYSVNYHRATSLAEAARLARTGEAKFLSGGMTLIPAMKTRLAAPSDLVDLTHIAELKGITISGGTVTIGAATTHAEVAGNAELKAACPAICHLAAHIGDPHVRHRGTIGGSIANNDPAADYPAALLALNATIVTRQPRDRGRKLLHGPVRDSAWGRRDGNGGQLRNTGQGPAIRNSPIRPLATP